MGAKEDREKLAQDRERRSSEGREQKLCSCGAVGTLESHVEWCGAAKEFNHPNTKIRTISKGRGPELRPLPTSNRAEPK